MTKQTVICPHCSRDIGLVGKGANVKLMRHNYMARNPISGAYVSKYPCEKGSGLLVLPLLLREAEREHDHAKKRFKEAEEEIKKAEAELHRTAAELDRLRAIK